MSSTNEKNTQIVMTNKCSNSAINNTKLASFSMPRDLSLGGSGGVSKNRPGQNVVVKKIYAPNLNVTRNKNINVKTSKVTVKNKGKCGKIKSNSIEQNRTVRDKLIQSNGVFSEGISFGTERKSSTSKSGMLDYTPDTLRKPILTKKGTNKTVFTSNQQNITNILAEDDDEDFENQKVDIKNIPLKLISKRIKEQQSVKLGVEMLKIDNSENLQALFGKFPLQFLMQLPDNLPYQNVGNKETGSKEENRTVYYDLNRSSLNEFEEGQIGKLIRYKSGKQKLVLGNIHFDLELGIDPGYLQEIVSINTNREERSGNIINLSSINAKFTVIPDWKQLFKELAT